MEDYEPKRFRGHFGNVEDEHDDVPKSPFAGILNVYKLRELTRWNPNCFEDGNEEDSDSERLDSYLACTDC